MHFAYHAFEIYFAERYIERSGNIDNNDEGVERGRKIQEMLQ